MSKKSTLELDYDRIWAALSRSTQARAALEKVAKEVQQTAKSLAKKEAFDTGEYADNIVVVSLPARQAREQLRGRNRTLGKRFDNPLLNAKFQGDPDGGAYDGTISVVAAKSWKSSLLEFGSLARNPSLIMTRSAEKAKGKGVRFTLLFEGKLVNQDLDQFSKAIKQARAFNTYRTSGDS